MASLKERVSGAVTRVRERLPFVDHLVRMQGQYGETGGSQQAGAVTYFGFLSVFPILALAFFVVGYVSKIYPGANTDLLQAIDGVLPDLIGNGEGKIPLSSIRTFSGLAGIIGVVGVLYSGLGWLSALRDALIAVFEKADREKPSFVVGKLRDLLTLAVIGTGLLLSVAITGVVGAGSATVLDWLGLGEELGWLVKIISVVLGLLANSALFFAMFELLGAPHAPRLAVWQGALFGAIGFEVLKQASSYLLAATQNQPAFQAFGIALILLVWINYFSRVILYAAAFIHTSAAVRRRRAESGEGGAEGGAGEGSAEGEPGDETGDAVPATAADPPGRRRLVAVGSSDSSWKDGFVDRIDAADPDDVGEASATAARHAHAQHRTDVRHRLLALGAAGSAAGVAVLAALRRRPR